MSLPKMSVCCSTCGRRWSNKVRKVKGRALCLRCYIQAGRARSAGRVWKYYVAVPPDPDLEERAARVQFYSQCVRLFGRVLWLPKRIVVKKENHVH